MKLQIKFKHIDYISLMEKYAPLIPEYYHQRDTALGILAGMLGHLDYDHLRPLIGKVPRKEANRFLSALVKEKNDMVISALNSLLCSNSIGLHVSRLALSPELELELFFDDVSYEQFSRELLFFAADKLASPLSAIVSHLPHKTAAKLIKLQADYFNRKYGIAVKVEHVSIQS